MNEEKSYEKFIFLMGELKGELVGIKDHLGKINGRVNKHDEQIAVAQHWQARSSGERAAVAKVAGVVSALTSLALTVAGFIIQNFVSK